MEYGSTSSSVYRVLTEMQHFRDFVNLLSALLCFLQCSRLPSPRASPSLHASGVRSGHSKYQSDTSGFRAPCNNIQTLMAPREIVFSQQQSLAQCILLSLGP